MFLHSFCKGCVVGRVLKDELENRSCGFMLGWFSISSTLLIYSACHFSFNPCKIYVATWWVSEWDLYFVQPFMCSYSFLLLSVWHARIVFWTSSWSFRTRPVFVNLQVLWGGDHTTTVKLYKILLNFISSNLLEVGASFQAVPLRSRSPLRRLRTDLACSRPHGQSDCYCHPWAYSVCGRPPVRNVPRSHPGKDDLVYTTLLPSFKNFHSFVHVCSYSPLLIRISIIWFLINLTRFFDYWNYIA
jgi:hypothetical protein